MIDKIFITYDRLKYAYFFKGKEGLYREIREVFRVR